MQIFVFLLLCNQQNNPWWFFSAWLLQTKWCNPCCYLWWHSTYSKCCLCQAIHWGWMCFCTFPHLLYNFCEKCSTIQAFALVVPSPGRQGLPGCMERIQLLLGVSSQKPKRNWLMIGLSRENKKTGNDRQLFFHLVLTSSVASLQSAKTDISFSATYILYICICVGVLLKHIVRV